MQGSKQRRNDQIIVIALFCMTYITSVRISGDLVRIPSYILLGPLLVMSFYRKIDKSLIVGYSIFCALSLAHIMLVYAKNSLGISLSGLLIDYAKYAGLLGIYILVFSGLSVEEINRCAIYFFKLLIITSIVLWITSVLLEIGIGVDISHNPWRLQGLATEPSNISHFLPAFLIFSFYNRMKTWAGTSLICVILTFSPTVYISTLFTIILVNFKYFGKYQLIIFMAILFGLLLLLFNNEAAAYSLLSGLGPIGESLIKLLEGIKFTVALGDEGSNSRGVLLLAGYDFMVEHNLLLSGVGFGSSNLVAESYSPINDGDLFDSTTWASLILWFGIYSILFYIILSISIVKSSAFDFQSLLLLNLLVSNTINGGGVWYQVMFFMMCYFKFRKTI